MLHAYKCKTITSLMQGHLITDKKKWLFSGKIFNFVLRA